MPAPIVSVSIENVRMPIYLDSGSSANLIDESIVIKLSIEKLKLKKTITATTAGTDILEMNHFCRVKVTAGDVTSEMIFLILPKVTNGILIGREGLRQMKAVLDFTNDSLIVNEKVYYFENAGPYEAKTKEPVIIYPRSSKLIDCVIVNTSTGKLESPLAQNLHFIAHDKYKSVLIMPQQVKSVAHEKGTTTVQLLVKNKLDADVTLGANITLGKLVPTDLDET